MMIIDTHIHVFDDTLAVRARSKLEATSGLRACTDLTAADTCLRLRSWGIDLGVVAPIATKASQQSGINRWAADIQNEHLISYGTVYPLSPEAPAELTRVHQLGLRGIKLHPDYQQFEADSPAVYPLYEQAAALHLPVLFHAGFDPVSPEHSRCRPAQIARIAHDLPGLSIVAAHLGGNCMYEDALTDLAGRDVYLDISLAPQFATFDQFRQIVSKHDIQRILFASDCPWGDPRTVIRWVERLPLGEDAKELIFWRNAARLLKIQSAKAGTNDRPEHPAS